MKQNRNEDEEERSEGGGRLANGRWYRSDTLGYYRQYFGSATERVRRCELIKRQVCLINGQHLETYSYPIFGIGR